MKRIVSYFIDDYKRTNFKKCLRFVVALIATPALIPATILSLVTVGIIEGLSDGAFPWRLYFDFHFNGYLGWYKIWE